MKNIPTGSRIILVIIALVASAFIVIFSIQIQAEDLSTFITPGFPTVSPISSCSVSETVIIQQPEPETTSIPTAMPSTKPTAKPSIKPTDKPAPAPENTTVITTTNAPTGTTAPTPTSKPTPKPTAAPAPSPTIKPTQAPSPSPSSTPEPTKPSETTVETTAAPVPTTTEPGELTPAQWCQALLDLTNAERSREGLPALKPIHALSQAAGVRAEEIAVKFSHTRPDGSSCFTVLAEFGVDYHAAGENIAMATAGYRTPEQVMEMWMNSSGHRANILSSAYTNLGIGYCFADGCEWFTQLFIG